MLDIDNKNIISDKTKSLRVLVLRPLDAATELAEQLQAVGVGSVHLLPMIRIVFFEPGTVSLENYSAMDGFVFTSVHAVDSTVNIIKHYQNEGKNLPWPPNKAIFAIGVATAKRLLDSGCQTADFSDKNMSSEGLLSLPSLQHVQDKFMMIFGGCNPRPLLKQTLLSRGAHVIYKHCYKREPVNYRFSLEQQKQLLDEINTIVCTSGEILTNFLANFHLDLYPLIWQKKFVVVSERLQKKLAELGCCRPVLVVPKPDNHTIVQYLIRGGKYD